MSKVIILLLILSPLQAQWQRIRPQRAPGYQQRVWTDVTSTVAMATAPIIIWELLQRDRSKPQKNIMRNCIEFRDRNNLQIFRCEDVKGQVIYLEMQ